MRSLTQSIILTGGTVVNSVLGLVFYIVIGRTLSLEAVGYFSFLLGIGVLAADIGDLGVSPSIIRFGHGDRFRAVFSVALLQRTMVGAIFFATALIAQQFYPANFFLSALVASCLLLLSTILQSFLAKQRYGLYVGASLLSNIFRLGAVLGLISGSLLTIDSALLAMVAANLLALSLGFIALCLLERGLPLVRSGLSKMLGEMARFGSFLGFSLSVSALASKLDNPLVFSLAGPQAAGLYFTAQRLSSIVPQVAGSLDGVFAPKFSKGEEIRKHFREYVLFAGVAALGILVVVPFTPLLLAFIFGPKYELAARLLQVLFVGMSLFIFSGPFTSSLIYRFSQTKLHFFTSLVQLALSVAFMALLIPHFAATGAALAFVIVQGLDLVAMISLYIIFNSRDQNNHSHSR